MCYYYINTCIYCIRSIECINGLYNTISVPKLIMTTGQQWWNILYRNYCYCKCNTNLESRFSFALRLPTIIATVSVYRYRFIRNILYINLSHITVFALPVSTLLHQVHLPLVPLYCCRDDIGPDEGFEWFHLELTYKKTSQCSLTVRYSILVQGHHLGCNSQ